MADHGPGESAAEAAAEALLARIGGPVDVAIVLGTGLGAIAEAVEGPTVVPYAEIPGFPGTGVSGHAGRLVVGRLAGRRVAVMQGRAHYYESGRAGVMRTPIETLGRLGAKVLVLTNAAGSLSAEVGPGELSLIADHINLSGANPLIGDRDDGRFVSLTDAYSPRLRARFRRAAEAHGIRLHEGVYAWFSGPSFETPAEIRLVSIVGGSLVGMSTVPEVILARRFGLEVAAISIVTNLAAGIEQASPSHAETKEVAARGGATLQRLLLAVLEDLDDD
ncbi:MAG: purine-nucleoside phosphorylase [Alsobacter sp.]